MNKQTLLEELQAENQHWEALLNQIPHARMEQPGVADDWSVKDLIAHLTGWRRRTVLRLQAALRGEQEADPPWPDELQSTDEINAWIYAANRDRSVDEVLLDSQDTFGQLLSAISALPEADLIDGQRFPWLEGEPLSANNLFGHFHEEHEADLRSWLAQQKERRM